MLTDAGRDYLAACKRVLEDVAEAERAASGEYTAPRGELIVTAPIVFGRLHVLPVAVDFLATYPEVDLRLVLGDRIVNLVEDNVDLAVRIGELPDSTLIAVRVGSIRRVICGSPRYFERHRAPTSPGGLVKHQCITFDPLMNAMAWEFNVAGSSVAVPVHSRLTVNTAEAAVDAASAGLGLTRVLSYQVEDATRRRVLSVVLKKFEPAPFPVHLVYSKQRRLPLKLRAFLDFAAPALRTRLAGQNLKA